MVAKLRTYEESIVRYPRLTFLLQDTMIASSSEAGCCIRDYQRGLMHGGECVSHSGLTTKNRIEFAIKIRHMIFKLRPMKRAALRERYKFYFDQARERVLDQLAADGQELGLGY